MNNIKRETLFEFYNHIDYNYGGHIMIDDLVMEIFEFTNNGHPDMNSFSLEEICDYLESGGIDVIEEFNLFEDYNYSETEL